MHILVTGGAGFIGSHLTEKLVMSGHSVVVLDDFSTGLSKNLDRCQESQEVEVVDGSVLDIAALGPLIEKADYIFHLAAAVGVFNIVNNPLASLLTNIRGTENVLELAYGTNTPVLITSSSEVYGKNVSNSLKEEDDRILGSPTVLRWSYSEAKAIDESLAYAYFVERQLETRIVRFFNTVGPRQLGSYGMVVPRFVQAALNNEPITIYGDGNQSRVFCHVADAVQAISTIAQSDSTIGDVYNVGGIGEVSIKELAEKVIAITGSKSTITYTSYSDAYPAGFEDIQRRVPDISKIKSAINWSPTKDLDQIISDIAGV